MSRRPISSFHGHLAVCNAVNSNGDDFLLIFGHSSQSSAGRPRGRGRARARARGSRLSDPPIKLLKSFMLQTAIPGSRKKILPTSNLVSLQPNGDVAPEEGRKLVFAQAYGREYRFFDVEDLLQLSSSRTAPIDSKLRFHSERASPTAGVIRLLSAIPEKCIMWASDRKIAAHPREPGPGGRWFDTTDFFRKDLRGGDDPAEYQLCLERRLCVQTPHFVEDDTERRVVAVASTPSQPHPLVLLSSGEISQLHVQDARSEEAAGSSDPPIYPCGRRIPILDRRQTEKSETESWDDKFLYVPSEWRSPLGVVVHAESCIPTDFSTGEGQLRLETRIRIWSMEALFQEDDEEEGEETLLYDLGPFDHGLSTICVNYLDSDLIVWGSDHGEVTAYNVNENRVVWETAVPGFFGEEPPIFRLLPYSKKALWLLTPKEFFLVALSNGRLKSMIKHRNFSITDVIMMKK